MSNNKHLRKVINIISGIIFGLAPLAGATIIGTAIYASFPNLIVVIVLGLLGVLSIWLGLKIFKRVQIVGPVRYMTASYILSDLNNHESKEGSEIKSRPLEEFGDE